MQHIAILGVDPRDRGAHIGFDADADVIPEKPMAIWHRTPPLAQKQAALGEMISGIVHDFRNILAVIGSAVRMAEMSSDEPERARIYLAGAQEGIDRGVKLTSELLTFATPGVSSEVGEVGIELYDVNLFLKKLEPLLNYGAGPGVQVELELAPDIPKCVVDPSGFEMAILNLVVNGRDAMAGAGAIRISTQRCSEPATSGSPESRRYVRVRVEDTGQGMTPEVVQRIFDPFFTTKGSEGTGLGLPQVHKFMRQLGGHTSVASERGIGTVIDLFFLLMVPGDSPPVVRCEVELGHVVGSENSRPPAEVEPDWL